MATQAGAYPVKTDSGHAIRVIAGSCTLTSGAISAQKGAGVTIAKSATGTYTLTLTNPGYVVVSADVNYEKATATADSALIKSTTASVVTVFTQSSGSASEIDGKLHFRIFVADSDLSP